MMPKTNTKPWDPAEHFASEAEMAAYLEAALEEGDPALIAAALGDIARARNRPNLATLTDCLLFSAERSVGSAA